MLGSVAQIDAMLRRVGSLVTFGAQTCYGCLEREEVVDASTGEMKVIGERITLLIRDGALTGLDNDEQLVVAGSDGGTFTVVSVGSAQSDGCRTLTLVEAT